MKKEKEMLIPKGWIPTRVVSVLLLSAACIGQGLAQGGSSADSPFGLQAPFCLPPLCNSQSPGYSNSKVVGYLSDVGVKWVRLVEPELDEVRYLLSENGINILAGLGVMGEEAIRASVGKYKDQVKHWLLVNEADGTWEGTPEEYAEYFISASSAIKDECPDCKVILSLAGGQVIGGELIGKGPVFFESALKNGVGPHFDVLDFHIQGAAGEYKDLIIKVDTYKAILEKYGIKNTPIWITEYGTYDGDPTPDHSRQPDYPLQTENQQAAELVKKYIYGVSLGVDKMFWTTMEEWYKYNGNVNSYFSNVGLVNNPLNDGKSHRKLSYYTYKKMVEVLEGNDWKNITTVQEQDGIYIYKFTKQGTPIWVAWNDSSVTRTVAISGITQNRVKATEAVPKYESGKEVADYTTAFRTDTLVVINGTVMLTLGGNPVFLELLVTTSVEDKRENIPKEFMLYQNYPNPFNPTTTIRFTIQVSSFTSLKVFDVLGREVATLVEGELNAGEHLVVFDAKGLASGVYFYKIQAGKFIQQKKMEVLK